MPNMANPSVDPDLPGRNDHITDAGPLGLEQNGHAWVVGPATGVDVPEAPEGRFFAA